MTSVDSIESFKLSGLRATLFAKAGGEISRKDVSSAIKGKGLAMKGFKKVELENPAAGYTLAIKGAGG